MTTTTVDVTALELEQARTASGCWICENGCNCKVRVPGEGCGHFACWGPDAVQSCPGAAAWEAYYSGPDAERHAGLTR